MHQLGKQNNSPSICAEIITDRLILRPSDDARDLADYLSHLETANEYFIQYGEERSDWLIAAIDFHSAPVCYYTVFRKDTGAMVGYVGVTSLQEEETGNLEFYIFREYRRNRYAYEALTALLDRFFDGTLTGKKNHTVIAETLAENEPSIRLLETLGFEKIGIGWRSRLLENGELSFGYDMERYALKNAETRK